MGTQVIPPPNTLAEALGPPLGIILMAALVLWGIWRLRAGLRRTMGYSAQKPRYRGRKGSSRP